MSKALLRKANSTTLVGGQQEGRLESSGPYKLSSFKVCLLCADATHCSLYWDFARFWVSYFFCSRHRIEFPWSKNVSIKMFTSKLPA